jgi:hypothetical protein
MAGIPPVPEYAHVVPGIPPVPGGVFEWHPPRLAVQRLDQNRAIASDRASRVVRNDVLDQPIGQRLDEVFFQ